MTAQMEALQQRILAQEAEMQELRARLAQAPAPQPVRDNQVVIAHPATDYFEKFRRMKAPEFEGSTDPLTDDEWLAQIRVILEW